VFTRSSLAATRQSQHRDAVPISCALSVWREWGVVPYLGPVVAHANARFLQYLDVDIP
jgi:hypothetical protein